MIGIPSGMFRFMKRVQLLQHHRQKKTKKEKRKSLKKIEIDKEKIGTVSVKESAKKKRNESENENEIEEIAKRAEAGVRGKIITKEADLLHLQATRSVIKVKVAKILKKTILNFIRLTPLVTNGKKMAAKIKKPIKMINQLK